MAPCAGWPQINVSYMATVLVKLLTLVLVFAHMEACLFWFIGDVQEDYGWTADYQGLVSPRCPFLGSFPPPSLPFHLPGLVGSAHGGVGGLCAHLQDPWSQYLVSLYWAVTTFTTVGYGDISPSNKPEMAFAVIIMVSGSQDAL